MVLSNCDCKLTVVSTSAAPLKAALVPSEALLSASVNTRRMAVSGAVGTAAAASSDAGIARVHSMMLSARGSPEATLCGNIQLAPVAGGAGGVTGAVGPPAPHAVRPVVAADTVMKPLYLRNCRLSICLVSACNHVKK